MASSAGWQALRATKPDEIEAEHGALDTAPTADQDVGAATPTSGGEFNLDDM